MPAPRGSLRRDILSAYALSGSRILSWITVSALVYRRSPTAFALIALVRGTVGILNSAALGLLPAMIRTLATRPRTAAATIPVPADVAAIAETEGSPAILPYATPAPTADDPDASTADPELPRIYADGLLVAGFTFTVTAIVAWIASARLDVFLKLPAAFSLESIGWLAFCFAAGIAIRWLSEPAAAVLQSEGHLWLDNLIAAGAEAAWVLLAAGSLDGTGASTNVASVGVAYLAAGAVLVVARAIAVHHAHVGHLAARRDATGRYVRPLLLTGLVITVAQIADYLYAPADYLLIDHLLPVRDLVDFGPLQQVDAALMALVTALAAALLPRAANAHAAGDRATVRVYYVRGTLATAALLTAASVAAYLAAPLVFRLWLGDPMPRTRSLLPLLLINTILGGSSAVGRSILLAVGRAPAFTTAVLLSGAVNVAASYAFVRYAHLGLHGILLGTVVAVVGRCGVWMPWYVLRTLRLGEQDKLNRDVAFGALQEN